MNYRTIKKMNLNIKGQGCMKIVSRYYETFVVDERRIEDNFKGHRKHEIRTRKSNTMTSMY